MRKGLYGIFIGTKWAMCRSKRRAIAEARKHVGATVRRMNLPARDNRSWDSPTFYVCSDQIFPAV